MHDSVSRASGGQHESRRLLAADMHDLYAVIKLVKFLS